MTMGFIYGPVNAILININIKINSRKILFTRPHVLLKPYSAFFFFFFFTKHKSSTKNGPKHHKRSAAIINDHNLTMVGFLCCRTLTWGLPRSQCSVLWELQCRWSSSCISWSPLSSASTALHYSPVCCHVHRTLPSHRYTGTQRSPILVMKQQQKQCWISRIQMLWLFIVKLNCLHLSTDYWELCFSFNTQFSPACFLPHIG